MKCDFVMQCYAKPHTIYNVFYDATALDKQIIFQLRQWTSVLHVTLRKLEIVIAIKKTPFVFVFNDQVVARVVAHYCIRAQTNFVLFCLPISLGVGVIVITLQWFNQYYCVDINDNICNCTQRWRARVMCQHFEMWNSKECEMKAKIVIYLLIHNNFSIALEKKRKRPMSTNTMKKQIVCNKLTLGCKQ